MTDLARGRPAEEAMRACLLVTALARSLRLSESEALAVYSTTLLRSVGCTATSREYAAAFGDDVRLRGRGDMTDPTVPLEAAALLWSLRPGDPTARRVTAFAGSLARARRTTTEGAHADCMAVGRALLHVFGRWDGKGSPRRLRGEAVAPAARFAAVAFAAVLR